MPDPQCIASTEKRKPACEALDQLEGEICKLEDSVAGLVKGLEFVSITEPPSDGKVAVVENKPATRGSSSLATAVDSAIERINTLWRRMTRALNALEI